MLKGDLRGVSKSLTVVATRVSWFVGAMLLVLFFTWLVMEISIIRKITVLTKRAASLSKTVKGTGGLLQFELGDLRWDDELGVLASCLHDLLQRVKEDVEREGIRAEPEKQMWHAVGHEIMSPLQSLMAQPTIRAAAISTACSKRYACCMAVPRRARRFNRLSCK